MAYGYGFTYMISAQVMFFIVTIGLIVWFVRNMKEKAARPKDILDNRLAAGEINKKEYASLLKLINR